MNKKWYQYLYEYLVVIVFYTIILFWGYKIIGWTFDILAN